MKGDSGAAYRPGGVGQPRSVGDCLRGDLSPGVALENVVLEAEPGSRTAGLVPARGPQSKAALHRPLLTGVADVLPMSIGVENAELPTLRQPSKHA